MALVYSYKEMPMHKALLLALPLVLAACAAQPPPQTTPMRQAQSPAPPQGMMENPVRFVPPEKGRGQTALQRLRDANREASRDVFDGYLLNICANGNSQAYNRIVSWTFPDD